MIYIKKLAFLIVFAFLVLLNASSVNAGWVNGYFRDNGTYVNGYWRTEPNYYKWDNYSFDNDWSDAYNDKSFYRDYGYDPEPLDNDYPNYSNWNSHDYDFDYDWDSFYDYDYEYDYNDIDYSNDYDYSYDW